MPSERIAFTGLDGLLAVLTGLSAAVRTEIMAPAVEKAAEPIRAAAANFAPVLTGSLKASIAIKTVRYPKKGTAVAVIGPARSNGKRGINNPYRRGQPQPAKYAHLVEFGHVSVKPIKGSTLKAKRKNNIQAVTVGSVAPQPFMRPGFLAGSPLAERILGQEISAGIERTRARLVKTGEHRA